MTEERRQGKKKKGNKKWSFKWKTHIIAFVLGVAITIIVLVAVQLGIKLQGNSEPVERKSSEVVKYLEKVNETVFLNVGIQDVEYQVNNTKIPWVKIGIPFSEKKAIIVLNYATKLGIKEVPTFVDNGENLLIKIPKYEVVGIELDKDDPYNLYDSSGGLLSYSTKDIDTGELLSASLSSEKQEKYLEQYQQQMNESAENYFKTLFEAVDPDLKISFEFAGQ